MCVSAGIVPRAPGPTKILHFAESVNLKNTRKNENVKYEFYRHSKAT